MMGLGRGKGEDREGYLLVGGGFNKDSLPTTIKPLPTPPLFFPTLARPVVSDVVGRVAKDEGRIGGAWSRWVGCVVPPLLVPRPTTHQSYQHKLK